MIVPIARYCKLELFNIAVKGQTRLSLSRNSLAMVAAGDVTSVRRGVEFGTLCT